MLTTDRDSRPLPSPTNESSRDRQANPDAETDGGQDGDLGDLLNELRVLLPGTTTLTAFLIILPFNVSFTELPPTTRLVYLATFLCSVVSMVLFTAPAAHHRMERPLKDRDRFKTRASRLMIAGLIPLSFAFVLATDLVVSAVVGDDRIAVVAAAMVAVLIAVIWWLVPLRNRSRGAT